MNTPDPLVTVVIPSLNRARYLTPTIESVLRQDYPRIECIVVDGGSLDGTIEILRRYGDRIKWVSEPDKGHADAVNKGWKMSHGEILAWLNADDMYVVPDAIGKAAAYLRENPRVDVVFGDYTLISEDGGVIRGRIQPPAWDLVSAVKYCHHIIPQATAFMRRSILEKVAWLDADFANAKDHELWLRIGLAGEIRYLPSHLAYVRQGLGLSQRADIGRAKVRVTEKFFRQPDLRPPFDSRQFKRRALSNSYLIGSVYIWRGTRQITPSLQYLMRAFITDPSNGPFILGRLTNRIIRAVFRRLPGGWQKKIRQAVRRLGIRTGESHTYLTY